MIENNSKYEYIPSMGVEFIKSDVLEKLKYININKVIIADSNITQFHPEILAEYNPIAIEASENSKTLETVITIIDELISRDAGKDTLLIGIGGGITTDITGFVASIFKRGLKFGFIPTTLMAMADASIGGKNGVNFNGIKNLAGVIQQPSFVYIYTGFLETLPDIHYYTAFSEIIKTGLVDNPLIIDLVESNMQNILFKDLDAIKEILEVSIRSKQSIVTKDEFESGLRKVLNFGHTFAHAAEIASGINHGLAVAAGILIDIKLSETILDLNPGVYKRIKRIFDSLGLDYSFAVKLKIDEFALLHDKKNRQSLANITLIKDLGRPQFYNIPIEELSAFYKNVIVL